MSQLSTSLNSEGRLGPALGLVLLGIVIWSVIPSETHANALLYWGSFFTTLFVLALVNAVNATRIALAGLLVGGIAVWFLRESDLAPVAINLLPWGISLSGVFLFVVVSRAARAHSRTRDRAAADEVSQLEPGSDASVRKDLSDRSEA